jgi:hypothetical protein
MRAGYNRKHDKRQTGSLRRFCRSASPPAAPEDASRHSRFPAAGRHVTRPPSYPLRNSMQRIRQTSGCNTRPVSKDLWAAGDRTAYRSPRQRHGIRVAAGRPGLSISFILSAGLICWKPLHSDLQAGRVCFADGPEARRAYAQRESLEPGIGEGRMVYKCLPGQHDDLGISCAILNWAAHHLHLQTWYGNMLAARRPLRRPRPKISSAAWS